MTEAELRQKNGELIPLSLVEERLGELFSEIRTSVLSIGDYIMSETYTQYPELAPQARRMIQIYVREALKNIADTGNFRYITGQSVKKQLDALENVIKKSLKIFVPPERIKVSEWADRYRYMLTEETSRPGLWRTSIVPCLGKIMDCFNVDSIEKVVFLKPTQVGGTEAGINIVGYIIDQQPCRILYVIPDEDVMKDFSNERLQKVLRTNECFNGKYYEDSKDLLLRYTGGFCKFGNAASAAKLASWSVPVIILDEIDKYPRQAGKESSPLKLAEERTKNWLPGKRKLFFFSTPTYKTGNIWQLYESADVRHEFQVPCPFCGYYQPLEWNNVKFDSSHDITEIQYNTYYECRSCGGHITDQYKPDMLEKWRWAPLNEVKGKPKDVAFKLNSLYSPWVTFGQMAAEFMKSKDEP